MKTHTTLSIDAKIAQRLKEKRAPLSLIFEKACQAWLAENATAAEIKAQAQEAGQEAQALQKQAVIAEIQASWKPAYATSPYLLKIWHDNIVPSRLTEAEYMALMVFLTAPLHQQAQKAPAPQPGSPGTQK
jgi:hypothetical protein